MTRLSITMPDPIAERVKEAAGDNVSGWLTRLARNELLRRELLALAEYDRQHPDPEWDLEQERMREHARESEA